MRLLPRVRLVFLESRRRIHDVVHPSMPCRADLRGLRVAVVDHPAPLEAKRGIDLAALGAVINVSEFILAHDLAVERRPDLRAEGLAIPPGEDAREEGFDFHGSPQGMEACSFMPAPPSPVQRLAPLVCAQPSNALPLPCGRATDNECVPNP